jgi:broad specificity phosphatase PhoE
MILLVRHGQTAANRDALLVGRIDPPLTELGEAQAQRLGERLKGTKPSLILSSPLSRTRDTANAIAASTGLPVQIEERLIEMNYGEWDGKPIADIPIEVWRQWRADPEFKPPGGESLHDVSMRVGSLMGELLLTDDPVIVVSHVSPIKAALTWALGAPDQMVWRMFIDVASISSIGMRQGAPCMLGFNETAHLL